MYIHFYFSSNFNSSIVPFKKKTIFISWKFTNQNLNCSISRSQLFLSSCLYWKMHFSLEKVYELSLLFYVCSDQFCTTTLLLSYYFFQCIWPGTLFFLYTKLKIIWKLQYCFSLVPWVVFFPLTHTIYFFYIKNCIL